MYFERRYLPYSMLISCAILLAALLSIPSFSQAQPMLPEGTTFVLSSPDGSSQLEPAAANALRFGSGPDQVRHAWRLESATGGFRIRDTQSNTFIALDDELDPDPMRTPISTDSRDGITRDLGVILETDPAAATVWTRADAFTEDAFFLEAVKDGQTYRLAYGRSDGLAVVFARRPESREPGREIELVLRKPELNRQAWLYVDVSTAGFDAIETALESVTIEFTFADDTIVQVPADWRNLQGGAYVADVPQKLDQDPLRARLTNSASIGITIDRIELRSQSGEMITSFPGFDKHVSTDYAWSFYTEGTLRELHDRLAQDFIKHGASKTISGDSSSIRTDLGESFLFRSTPLMVSERAALAERILAPAGDEPRHLRGLYLLETALITPNEQDLFRQANLDWRADRVDARGFIEDFFSIDKRQLDVTRLLELVSIQDGYSAAVRHSVHHEIALLTDARREVLDSFDERTARLEARYRVARAELEVFQRYALIQDGSAAQTAKGIDTAPVELMIALSLLQEVPIAGPLVGKVSKALLVGQTIVKAIESNNRLGSTVIANRAATRTEVRNRTLVAINNVAARLDSQEKQELAALRDYYQGLLTDIAAMRHIVLEPANDLTKDEVRAIRRAVWQGLLPVRTSLIGQPLVLISTDEDLGDRGVLPDANELANLKRCAEGDTSTDATAHCSQVKSPTSDYVLLTASYPFVTHEGVRYRQLWGWRLTSKPWDADWDGDKNTNDGDNLGKRIISYEQGGVLKQATVNVYLRDLFGEPWQIAQEFAQQGELFAQTSARYYTYLRDEKSQLQEMAPRDFVQPIPGPDSPYRLLYNWIGFPPDGADNPDRYKSWLTNFIQLSALGGDEYKQPNPDNGAFVYDLREIYTNQGTLFSSSGWQVRIFFETETYDWP